ncbi:MAG: M15 family metallopeptidase [Actinomycetota bacterium]|nr:M15 family metallopeptidase [Actinomycetota bacterium]
MARTRTVLAVGVAALALTTCGRPAPPPPVPPVPPFSVTRQPPPPPAVQPAAWTVGATPLPLRPDGFGEVLPTPAVLADRSLPTRDGLPPPSSGAYESSIVPVPPDVLARSTWQSGCPVTPEDLRYLTMSFLGFDGRPHTGEMLVHADVAADVVGVFERLFTARFPLEEMRVVAAAELDLAPTGDGNNTSAFVCRAARGQPRWSAHAHGLAIDVNPFCNPYVRDDLVLPELASAYLDRDRERPGMIADGGPVVAAFEEIGWSWGGRWSEPLDLMHFSATGD